VSRLEIASTARVVALERELEAAQSELTTTARALAETSADLDAKSATVGGYEHQLRRLSDTRKRVAEARAAGKAATAAAAKQYRLDLAAAEDKHQARLAEAEGEAAMLQSRLGAQRHRRRRPCRQR
jgi:chromosome segregation ATPase